MRTCLPAALLLALLGTAPHPAGAQSAGAVLPVIGSAPETGFQGGVAYLRAHQPDDSLGTRPSSLMGNAVYTQKRQFRAFIDSDRWTPGNARRHQWGVVVMAYPLPFDGPSVSQSAEPSRIENDALDLWFTESWMTRPGLWYSIGGRVVANLSDGEVGVPPGGCGALPCQPPIGPIDYVRAFEHTSVVASVGRIADTRDQLFAPTAGKFLEVTLSAAYNTSAAETFSRLRLDWRRYRRVRQGTLAVQGLLQGTAGRPTVDQLVVMGGNSVLRGYEMGRLRDRWLIGGQAEWRGPTRAFKERMGFVAFAGGAHMARRVASSEGKFFPSVGGGFRWLLDRNTRSAVRVDYAFGSAGNSGLYIAFNEAF